VLVVEDDRKRLREMADLLREGATMLAQSCPVCNVPLFRLKSGEVICPSCKRRVVVLKEGEDVGGGRGVGVGVDVRLREVLSRKLAEVIGRIEEVEDEDRLLKLLELARRINELLREV